MFLKIKKIPKFQININDPQRFVKILRRNEPKGW